MRLPPTMPRHVCVMTGAGPRAFCAASDLSEFTMDGSNHYPATGYAGIAQRYDTSPSR